MEEICPQAEATIEADNGFQLKHPEIPFIRACKMFEDQRLVRSDFWLIYKAQRQDARNAILEASRQRIEQEKTAAAAELARQQAILTEARVKARNEADAKLAAEQRRLDEERNYNLPQNVQRRQEIATAEAARLDAEAKAAEAAANAETARINRQAAADRRKAAAQQKVDDARARAVQSKADADAAFAQRQADVQNSVPSERSGRSSAAFKSMSCSGFTLVYSVGPPRSLVSTKDDGTETNYPIAKVETSPDGVTIRAATKFGHIAAFYANSVDSNTRVFWTSDQGIVVQECTF
jgi:pyruvate/2-oxoglutarate dehydrogenase complex dihydrolipoamide acyltransferase (E2) component